MEKAEQQRIIGSLEGIKTLITQAQALLEDGDDKQAISPLNTAYMRLTGEIADLSTFKGGTSTERM